MKTSALSNRVALAAILAFAALSNGARAQSFAYDVQAPEFRASSVADNGDILGFQKGADGNYTASVLRRGEVESIPPVKGTNFTASTGISPNGRYQVGYATVPNSYYGTILQGWVHSSEGSSIETLTKEGYAFWLNGINNEGMAVGTKTKLTLGVGQPRAIAWLNGTIMELPLPSGYTNTIAVSCNKAGNIIGTCRSTGYTTSQPVMWVRTGFMTWVVKVLPAPKGGGWVRAINNSNVVVGDVYNGRLSTACLWDSTGAHLLSTPTGTYSIANGIDAAGRVYGSFNGSDVVMWTTMGALPTWVNRNLNIFRGTQSGILEDVISVNNSGQMICSLVNGFDRVNVLLYGTE